MARLEILQVIHDGDPLGLGRPQEVVRNWVGAR